MRTPDHLYRDTIKIYGEPTLNKFGEKADEEGVNYPGRFVERNFTIRDASGKETNCDGLVHISGSIDIAPDRTIGYNGAKYDVVSVKRTKDAIGNVRFSKLSVKLRK